MKIIDWLHCILSTHIILTVIDYESTRWSLLSL